MPEGKVYREGPVGVKNKSKSKGLPSGCGLALQVQKLAKSSQWGAPGRVAPCFTDSGAPIWHPGVNGWPWATTCGPPMREHAYAKARLWS